jgi:hypothetical protein
MIKARMYARHEGETESYRIQHKQGLLLEKASRLQRTKVNFHSHFTNDFLVYMHTSSTSCNSIPATFIARQLSAEPSDTHARTGGGTHRTATSGYESVLVVGAY